MERTSDLRAEFVAAQYRSRRQIVDSFFSSEADRIARLCHLMAQRFARGGRLIAFGLGAAATDAQHVSVEFVHPVIVGKRALPALALPNDVSILGSAVADPSGFFARRLEVVGRPEDVALGIVHGPDDPGVEAVAGALKQAVARGMLTMWLGVPGVLEDGGAEHRFAVPTDDVFITQEVQETLYHVLWELVHVFFEHKGLLEGRTTGTSHDSGRSSFLYPFLAEAESDVTGVLDDVKRSILDKAGEVGHMREQSCDPEGLVQTAQLMSQRIDQGAKVLAFGNGGSATDAQDFVVDLIEPPEGMSPVNALSLTNEEAVITAVANDVGFDNVFARQVIAYGAKGDIAFAISTSGGSRNVVAAVEEAKRRGMLTVALAGYEGGRLKEICDRCHTISADYVPRIQEAQATQYHVLRRLIGSA